MFRRKEDGTEILDDLPESDNETSSSAESVSAAFSPGESGRVSTPATPSAPATPAAQPLFRPATPSASASVPAARSATPGVSSSSPSVTSASGSSSTPAAASSPITANAPKSSKRVLTVGPDIQMKGEITTCDRVVIEGTVDATLTDVHTVELAQSGSLKGTAEVEDAEISGMFEGDLIVRGRLIIYSTGIIRGNITYGEIEIERGGQISGSIRNVDEAGTSGSKAASGQRRAA